VSETRLEVRSDPQVFDDLSQWWDGCPGPLSTPFLRSDWFALWAGSFLDRGQQLEVAVWRQGDEIVAALPLMKGGMRRASLSNSHGDVFDLIAPQAGPASDLVGDWLARRPATRLYRLDGSSPLVPEADDGDWVVTGTAQSPYVSLARGLDGLRDAMGRNLNKNIDRLERKIAGLGEVVYLDNADGEVPRAVEQCLDMEAAGWKGETGTAMTSRPESARFYRGLIDLARDRGWLRVCALLVAERLVAFQLCLDYGDRRFLLKPSFDENLRKHSPGKVLQWMVLRSAVEQGLDAYEFGGDAEDWKMHWTDTTHPRVTGIRFGSKGAGAVVGKGLRLAYRRG
jgi:CelD/BcsL family acetyltransferase involved in cellulose biosynthesis